MKKIFAMAVALVAAVTVNAQDLTDNYQKVYAGWMNYNAFDASSEAKAANGFNLGYAYAFNIAGHNMPLFLEVGGEYAYLSKSYDTVNDDDQIVSVDSKAHTLTIPVNITYKFGNEKFSVAPFIGEAIRTYLSATDDGKSVFDGDNTPNRVQAVFNVGVNFVINSHFQIGYRFQASETTFESDYEIKYGDVVVFKNDPKNDYTNSITFGYIF